MPISAKQTKSVADAVDRILVSLPGAQALHEWPNERDWQGRILRQLVDQNLDGLYKLIPSLNDTFILSPYSFRSTIAKLSPPGEIELWEETARSALAMADHPFAACILALIALIGWSSSSGAALFQDYGPDQRRYPGWDSIPYAAVRTAINAHALEGAQTLAEFAHDVLMNAKNFSLEILLGLQKYRALYSEASNRLDFEIASLADELRSNCGSESSIRAEIGALLWSAGYVPESQALKADSASTWIPSSRMLRALILWSLFGFPTDPLEQHIWLSIRNKVSLRSYRSLYAKMNIVFRADNELGDTGELFAEALIGWFAGRRCTQGLFFLLAEYELELIRESIEVLASGGPITAKQLASVPIAARLTTLGDILRKERDPDNAVSLLGSAVELVYQWRKSLDVTPGLIESTARVSVPHFYRFQELISKDCSTSSAEFSTNRLVKFVESSRVAPLLYWLLSVRVRPTLEEEETISDLLIDESMILRDLRGAYFFLLLPSLPHWFSRVILPGHYAASPIHEDSATVWACWQRAVDRLRAVHHAMRSTAPKYVAERSPTVADLATIKKCLSAHRVDA